MSGITTVLSIAAIGALLGFRFKVFVLVPAIGLSLVVSCGIGSAHGNSLESIFLAAFSVVGALQVGYLAGIAIRFRVAKARAGKHPSGNIAVAQRR